MKYVKPVEGTEVTSTPVTPEKLQIQPKPKRLVVNKVIIENEDVMRSPESDRANESQDLSELTQAGYFIDLFYRSSKNW